MRRIGRRAGFIFGASIGLVGGLVAAEAVIRSDFLMFCVATLLMGSSMAFTQQYRFAAAESAPPHRLSQAVSYVLVGSFCAAIVNPQLALAARWLVPGTQYAGSFVAVALLYAATIAVLSRLHVPPPSVPRPKVPGDETYTPFATPQFKMAVFAGACAYAVMSFVMTAAPISMHNLDHHGVEATTWVVQSHVLSMYLPSLFTGHVIARFGERTVMMWGSATNSCTTGWGWSHSVSAGICCSSPVRLCSRAASIRRAVIALRRSTISRCSVRKLARRCWLASRCS
jgi:MFS family permease